MERVLCCAFFSIFLASSLAVPAAAQQTIEFETTEVTEADVTVSPDGLWLIFTMLGHLFRLPATGGTAEQLTFGPYYHSDPVFSPDGRSIAFVSDRDGSEGNVYVMSLDDGTLRQISNENWAARPTWSGDGRTIFYLKIAAVAKLRTPVPATVRRVSLASGQVEDVSGDPELVRSVFSLPDGRIGWSVLERDTSPLRWRTRIDILSKEGSRSAWRTLPGYIDRLVPAAEGEGLYGRRHFPLHATYVPARAVEQIVFVSLEGDDTLEVCPVSAWSWSPQFGVDAGSRNLFVGDRGGIWRIAPHPAGARCDSQPTPLRAKVRLEVNDPSPPRRPSLGGGDGELRPTSILDPSLSPDGRTLVFVAAEHLWLQAADGRPAQRVTNGTDLEHDPAWSPDGHQIAYVATRAGRQQLRIIELATGRSRTVASADAYVWYSTPSWSPDGKTLAFVESGPHRPATINLLDLVSGLSKSLADLRWPNRPHFSAEGRVLYWSGLAGGTIRVFELRLDGHSEPQLVVGTGGNAFEARISADAKWLAFRRNDEIWVAQLEDARRVRGVPRLLSSEGGGSFSFTPDGTAVLYSSAGRLWRISLQGGKPEEIPVRLRWRATNAPSTLIKGVRLLDFNTGRFSPESSLLIEGGRIQWMGSGPPPKQPPGTRVIEAEGRFAIPGLFDLHQHMWGYNLPFVAYGITSVRDVGGYLLSIQSQADRSALGGEPLPRYFFSGDFFYFETQPPSDSAVLLRDPDDARAYIRRYAEAGVHFIKLHPPISWQAQRAAAEEARSIGIPIVGHGTMLDEVVRGITLGYWTLEHTNQPGPLYEDVLKALAASGTRWVPTLGTTIGSELYMRRLQHSDAMLRSFFPDGCRETGTRGMSGVGDALLKGAWARQIASIAPAKRHGVRLGAGTDIFYWGARCYPGLSLHWELEHLVEGGLTPFEALRSATQTAAEIVGAEHDLGTLEAGKLADIVLLNKNPLQDIRNTQTIWRVIRGGWLFDPEQLRPPTSASSLEGKQ